MSSPFESITVLVIDDDDTERELLIIYLKKIGVKKFLQASGSDEAMSILLQSGPPDVQAIFTDLDMPGVNGRGFIEELRNYPHLSHLGVAMSTNRLTDSIIPSEDEEELREFLEANRVLPLAKNSLTPLTLEQALKDMTGL